MRTLLFRPFIDSTIGNSPLLSIRYIPSYLKSRELDVKSIDKCVDKRMIGNFFE